jgi:hypothetical protein
LVSTGVALRTASSVTVPLSEQIIVALPPFIVTLVIVAAGTVALTVTVTSPLSRAGHP